MDLAEEMVEIAKTSGERPDAAVWDMIRKCINRDSGWRSFYDNKVRKKTREVPSEPNRSQIQFAMSEHVAQKAALQRDSRQAVNHLDIAINSLQPKDSQLVGYSRGRRNYVFETDEGEALEIQKTAYQKNDRMCPPPPGVVVRPPPLKKSQTASLLLSWYNRFTNPNGVIAELEELKSKLSFDSTTETLEQALDDVSRLFGAEGVRPEKQYRRGPDNLWIWPDFAWIMEVKHQRNTLPKTDGSQLLSSMRWFNESYPERTAVPVVVARLIKPERDAFFPEDTRVFTPNGLDSLLDNLGRFLTNLVKQKPLFWEPPQINDLLHRFGLAPSQFAGNYTENLQK